MKKSILAITLFSLIMLSCTNSNIEKEQRSTIATLQSEIDSLQEVLANTSLKKPMYRYLTFQDNNAENAMNFYVELFGNSEILNIDRWGKDAPVAEGKIFHATFQLDSNLFMCSDSPAMHEWDFTPAVSNFIECETEAEIDHLYANLSQNGSATMPLNNYGFSKKFAWVVDQFGVSWQLNLN